MCIFCLFQPHNFTFSRKKRDKYGRRTDCFSWGWSRFWVWMSECVSPLMSSPKQAVEGDGSWGLGFSLQCQKVVKLCKKRRRKVNGKQVERRRGGGGLLPWWMMNGWRRIWKKLCEREKLGRDSWETDGREECFGGGPLNWQWEAKHWLWNEVKATMPTIHTVQWTDGWGRKWRRGNAIRKVE